MTDDASRRDELASAHLDGATTPAEAAEVEASAVLRERLEVLAEVRRRVGEAPPPPADDRRDAAVAAAIRAFDAADPAAADRPDAVVRTLRPRREGFAVRIAVAAAVLLVALALVPALVDSGSDHQDTAASGTAEDRADDEATVESGDDAPAAMSAPDAAISDEAPEDTSSGDDDLATSESADPSLPVPLVELGAHVELDGLTSEVERRLLDDPGSEPTTDVVDDSNGDARLADCADDAVAGRDGELRLRGLATLGAGRVLVVVVDDDMVVSRHLPGAGSTSCVVVAELPVDREEDG